MVDQGAGVRPDVRGTIFEPFVSTKDGGTGLGLWVARRIVSEHGGSIELAESSATGSRFAISLPANSGERALSA